LLSNIFFNSDQFPQASAKTNKFIYNNEKNINLDLDITIKGITNTIPVSLKIIKLAKELIQIEGKLKFSRNSFKIGIDQWQNKSILKDQVVVNLNLFLFKK
jgi:Uncharacterized conserved protein